MRLERRNYHCYNMVNGCVFDLTREQFGTETLSYTGNPVQVRDIHFEKEEKRIRYETLKDHLKAYCKNKEQQVKRMNHHENLEELTKEQLMELIDIYSKNWIALDGVWFQSIEEKLGMDEAMVHDEEAWKRYTRIEARRIKQFLHQPEHAGLAGLEQALKYRFYANLNEHRFEYDAEGSLIYTMSMCRVQHARKKKGLPYHPCKQVAIQEYSGFAEVIDDRIKMECLSCYPDVTDETCSCKWKFWI